MANDTKFAGLTSLAPGESVAADGGSFLWRNPVVIDALLRLGGVTHRHDAAPALPDPTDDPIVTLSPVGGLIPHDTPIYIGYTLYDWRYGETKLNTFPAFVTTSGGIEAPTQPPAAAADYTAGALLAATYQYALTVTDGAGGETTLSPFTPVTIDPGFASAQVQIAGLSSALAETGGTTWRLWRSTNSSIWYLLDEGTSDTFVDDGTIGGDCTIQPPDQTTTASTSLLTVTVPAPGSGASSGAIQFSIYESSDGVFDSPALLGTYPMASAGVPISFPSLNLSDGSPPPVSLAWPGANKIDPDTELLDWTWKRPVSDVAHLPSAGCSSGDVRVSLDTQMLYVWAGGAWERSPWRNPVPSSGALGALADPRIGDVCLSIDTYTLYILEGGGWTAFSGGGGGGGSAYWANAVSDFNSALAGVPGTVDGEVVLTRDTKQMWVWDAGASNWFRLPWFMPVANAAALPNGISIPVQDGDMCLTLDTYSIWTFDATNAVWRESGKSRQAILNHITGLTAGTEAARSFNMPGNATVLFSVTVSAACRVRFYPTTALASSDQSRVASSDPDVAAQNGCYYEHTFAGAGTHILTPTAFMVRQDATSPTAKVIAGNVSVPSGTAVDVTLNGYEFA